MTMERVRTGSEVCTPCSSAMAWAYSAVISR